MTEMDGVIHSHGEAEEISGKFAILAFLTQGPVMDFTKNHKSRIYCKFLCHNTISTVTSHIYDQF